MTKLRNALVLATVGLGMAVPAAAQTATAQDYSTLTSAVDWGSAITALMAVAAIVAGVFVVRKGIRFVLAAIK